MMKCPLCGGEFSSDEMVGCSSCPLSKGCNLLCCPNCGYEWVEESRTINFIKRIFSRKEKDAVREV